MIKYVREKEWNCWKKNENMKKLRNEATKENVENQKKKKWEKRQNVLWSELHFGRSWVCQSLGTYQAIWHSSIDKETTLFGTFLTFLRSFHSFKFLLNSCSFFRVPTSVLAKNLNRHFVLIIWMGI